MKKFILISAIILIITCLSYAQNPQWLNYTNGDHISALVEDGNYMWIGTGGGGLVQLDKNTGILTFYNKTNSDLPNNFVTSLVHESNGTKWIGTWDGLAAFDGANWTVYDISNFGLPYNVVSTLAIDGNGTKWIGTNDGLAAFDGTNWTVYNTSNSGLPDNNIRSLAIDGNGTKWIGTDDGLATFDGANWTVYNSFNSGLPDNEVTSLAIDKDNGTKWIGRCPGLLLERVVFFLMK